MPPPRAATPRTPPPRSPPTRRRPPGRPRPSAGGGAGEPSADSSGRPGAGSLRSMPATGLRRHRGRRRPQRPRRRRPTWPGPARTVVLERRPVVGGAAVTEQPWGPDYKVTTLSYVVSLLPPTILRDLELERHGYQRLPAGPVLRAVPGRPLAAAAARSGAAPGRDRASSPSKDADAVERWDAWLHGLAGVLGPLLSAVPPKLGSRRPADVRRPGPPGVAAAAAGGRAPGGRRDPVVHHVDRRPARRLLRVARDAGRAVGVRRDRHVGRAPLAGHGLRDGPPQDRRRRRRRARLVGLPRGRHGRADRRRWRRRRGRSAPRSAPTPPVAGSPSRDGRVTGVVLADGEELTRAGRGHHRAPEDRLPPDCSTARDLPPEFVDDIERWNTRSGTVKVNLAVDRLPEFTSQARVRPRGARRHHRAGPLARRGGDGVPGRRRRPPGGTAVRRHLHPVGVRPDAGARGSSHRVDVHPVGAGGVGGDARRGRARGLRRPRDRHRGRGRAGVRVVDPAPQRDRAVRDGAHLRARRRQHLPRRAVAEPAVPHAAGAGLRRLPHARRRPVPGRIGHPRGRRRDGHPRPERRAPDRRPVAPRRRPSRSDAGGTAPGRLSERHGRTCPRIGGDRQAEGHRGYGPRQWRPISTRIASRPTRSRSSPSSRARSRPPWCTSATASGSTGPWPRRPARSPAPSSPSAPGSTSAGCASGSTTRRAAGLVGWDADERYSLTPEANAVLADPTHPSFGHGHVPPAAPDDGASRGGAGESFRTASATTTTPRPRGAAGIEATSARGTATTSCRWRCPPLDGVVERLTGAPRPSTSAAGPASPSCTMAEAFPASDLPRLRHLAHALARAEASRASTG